MKCYPSLGKGIVGGSIDFQQNIKRITSMPTKYGFILASATLSLLVYFPATAALGDKGNMLDACNGTDVKLTKLCQIAKDRIHTPGGEYVHLAVTCSSFRLTLLA